MNCPKCKSANVSESTAKTFRCADCDYSFVDGLTAPRWRDAGVPKKESSSAGLVVLLILVVLIAIVLGFVSLFASLVVGILGLLAGILYQLTRLANKNSRE